MFLGYHHRFTFQKEYQRPTNSLSNTDDNITLSSYFTDDQPVGSIILHHENGTISEISSSQLKALTISGTLFDDVIQGYMTDDVIYGQAGNDDINSLSGNDILDGAGNDKLNACEGKRFSQRRQW